METKKKRKGGLSDFMPEEDRILSDYLAEKPASEKVLPFEYAPRIEILTELRNKIKEVSGHRFWLGNIARRLEFLNEEKKKEVVRQPKEIVTQRKGKTQEVSLGQMVDDTYEAVCGFFQDRLSILVSEFTKQLARREDLIKTLQDKADTFDQLEELWRKWRRQETK